MNLIAAITLTSQAAPASASEFSAFVVGNYGFGTEVKGMGFGISVDLRQEKPTRSRR